MYGFNVSVTGGFDKVVERVTEELQKEGFGVLTEIDVAATLKKKIDAIAEFRSQKQIKSLIELIRRAGPVEYLRPVPFSLYNPHVYRDMFEELPQYGYGQMHR